jgi:adenosine deaminase
MPLQLTESKLFRNALENNDLKGLRKIAKSDLHNHCMMGGRLAHMEKFYGKQIPKFSYGDKGIQGINDWIALHYRPVLDKTGSLEAAIEGAFVQAKSDGITLLEMSIDIFFGRLFNISPDKIIRTLDHYHKIIAPGIEYRPEIGFARNLPVRAILQCIEPYFDSGFFYSIDLYDDEFSQPIKNFREIYRYAKKLGLKCKAHAGEFGTAESVREIAEVLELDAIQHGIAAAASPEIMRWLSENKIGLNVCPASNIILKRAKSYKAHPIRILFDHGVNVTVNTDDVMLFGQGNSEQFLRLYKTGCFTIDELDRIRINGLS